VELTEFKIKTIVQENKNKRLNERNTEVNGELKRILGWHGSWLRGGWGLKMNLKLVIMVRRIKINLKLKLIKLKKNMKLKMMTKRIWNNQGRQGGKKWW